MKSNVDCSSVTKENASSFFDAFESFDLKYKKVGTYYTKYIKYKPNQ